MPLARRPHPDGRWETSLLDVAIHLSPGTPLVPLPDIACKGLCVAACRDVPMSEPERMRAERDLGEQLGMFSDGTCNALDDRSGRCRVYLNRPLVCRLYGVAEGMICAFGCELVSGSWLTYAESIAHLADLERRDGSVSIPVLPPRRRPGTSSDGVRRAAGNT